MASFPQSRLRRLRESGALRRMVRETSLSVKDLVYPMFIAHGCDVLREIPSMPDVYQLSLDRLLDEVVEIDQLGIPAVLLFGIPMRKDPLGMEAYDAQGIVQEAIRVIKQAAPELLVITDVCLCEYTDHGHCGLIVDERVDNDATLEILARVAVSHVDAGADVVAPSAMMDGQVAAIRRALDEGGHSLTPILGYSAKYASSFYGPFREAAESAPQFGDRRGYQMDHANARQALREMETDIQEGADLIMVKPALAYLDVIARARDTFHHPIVAYNVSGEYSMVRAASANGWIDGPAITLEILTAIKRAGADVIITYSAKDVAVYLGPEGQL